MKTLKIGIASYDGHEGANHGDRAGQAQAETGRSQGVVYLDREFCEGFVEQEPRPARDDRGEASGFTSGAGRAYRAQTIQSVPDVEDDGALWLRAASSRGARTGPAGSALSGDLSRTRFQRLRRLNLCHFDKFGTGSSTISADCIPGAPRTKVAFGVWKMGRGWRRSAAADILCRRPLRSQSRPRIGRGNRNIARVRGAHT